LLLGAAFTNTPRKLKAKALCAATIAQRAFAFVQNKGEYCDKFSKLFYSQNSHFFHCMIVVLVCLMGKKINIFTFYENAKLPKNI
jgi:hypothetical protein